MVLWLVASVVVIYLAVRRRKLAALAMLYVWSWVLLIWLDNVPVASLAEANLLFWITAVDGAINVACVVTFMTIAFRRGWFHRRRR